MSSFSEQAHVILGDIRDLYPDLASSFSELEEGGGFEIVFPEQPGLSFPLTLMFLEKDILQLEIPEFCAEFFPSDDPKVASRFFDAACGLIEGRFRVCLTRRKGRVVKGELQEENRSDWQSTYHYYAGFGAWAFWTRKTQDYVQNVSAA